MNPDHKFILNSDSVDDARHGLDVQILGIRGKFDLGRHVEYEVVARDDCLLGDQFEGVVSCFAIDIAARRYFEIVDRRQINHLSWLVETPVDFIGPHVGDDDKVAGLPGVSWVVKAHDLKLHWGLSKDFLLHLDRDPVAEDVSADKLVVSGA